MKATRQEIVVEARGWRGVPWRHQGRTRIRGIDCVGLPIVVAKHLGLADIRYQNYPRRPDGTFLQAFEGHGCVRIKVSEAQPGDILVFSESGRPCHCGIMSRKDIVVPAVIHAHAMRRKVIEESLAEAKSVIGRPTFAFAMPGVEN